MSRRPHRLRYRDEESSASVFFLVAGAVAGAAAGVLLAQRYGGLSGISARVREGLSERFAERFPDGLSSRLGRARRPADADAEEYGDEDDYDTAHEGGYQPEESDDDSLEGRVLTAFRNDPIMSERGVDIGMVSDGIIELSGTVHAEDEIQHALTLTRGVPGVSTVLNRLSVRDEEEGFRSSSQRYAEGDPRYAEAHWEGQQVGTGRRRQGVSTEFDRHATPKPELEDRWLNEEQALNAAADDTEGLAERREKKKAAPKGDRTGGAPIAPSGVPKGDHVAEPLSDETADVLRDSTGRDTTRRAD